MKITYQQMILIFIFVMMLFFIINMFFPQWGPIVTMVGMISIFIAFKVYQRMKKKGED